MDKKEQDRVNNRVNNSNPNSNDLNNNIEDQIAKSIEKLVEEETNGARAFVNGNEADYSDLYQNDADHTSGAQSKLQQEDLFSGKTQVIPEIPKETISNLGETKEIHYEPNQTGFVPNNNDPENGNVNMGHSDEMKPDYNQDDFDQDLFEQNMSRNIQEHMQQEQQMNQQPGRQQSQQMNQQPGRQQGQQMNQQPGRQQGQQMNQQPGRQQGQQMNQQQGRQQGQQMNQQPGRQQNYQMNLQHPDADQQDSKEGMPKKKKLMIAGIIALAIIIIAAIVSTIVIVNKSHKSFNYNYKQGMEKYDQGAYDDALNYFEKAYKTTDGKRSTDLMYNMYDCYKHQDNVEKEKSILNDLLTYDKNNEKGIKALAQLYLDEEDGTSLTALIKKYKGSKGEDYLKNFMLDAPEPSEKGGDFNKALEITLTSDDDTTIYYTTDGKDPTKDSSIYLNPIKVEKGTTVIKAFAMNSIGLCSDIAENKYVVEYKKPDAPTINPTSGTYDAGKTFTIDNLQDGDTAYYTLDGTDPTKSSNVYSDEVEIPEGNIVVAAIIVNQYDLESSVTRRNYNIKATKTYTYDEAQAILAKRMVSRNDLKSTELSSSGNRISFVYQNKIKIADVEMYYIRIDESRKGSMVTLGYYGVGTKDGKCYKVTTHNGSYVAQDY